MAEIELVFKIDEEQYKFIKQNMTINKIKYYPALLYDICEHIRNGVLLPKGHGRLFDERDIVNGNYEIIGNKIYEIEPTVEADKEQEE